MSPTPKRRPNILITGTPGTGKTTLADMLVDVLDGYQHVEVSRFAKERQLLEGYDEVLDTHVIEEDAVLDAIEPFMTEGGVVVDYHSCEFFPERWFDLIVVLTCDNTVLYDRLVKRGYSTAKISENVQCEIMQVVLDEARSSYEERRVVALTSESVEQMEGNLERIKQWAVEHEAALNE